MKKLLIAFCVVIILIVPVFAEEITAPKAPDSVEDLVPKEPETFGEGLWYIVKQTVRQLNPDVAGAAKSCLCVVTAVILTATLNTIPSEKKKTAELICALSIGGLLLQPANAMIRLGTDTVTQISEYGKLLLPVMTTALAAQGAAATSASLYAGTVVFDSVLGTVLSGILTPAVYVYIALSVANAAVGEDGLKRLSDFVKWLLTWILKSTIYIYVGYMGITGVVTGNTDAAALKATKIAISGMVPVVGNMLSDASEAILVSAGVVKNAVGIYGLLVTLAIWIRPFLKIGIQYLMLKITAAVCGVFGTKESSDLIQNFSAAMGFLLAATGTMCLLMLISTVCFVKGVG